MYLVSIIPTTDNAQHDKLSYFSKTEIALGSLIEAPYGRSSIKGIVYKNEKIQDVKGALKDAHFSVKKINKIISTPLFNKTFIEKLIEISENKYIHIGKLFSYITPNWYYDLKNRDNLNNDILNQKTIVEKIQNNQTSLNKTLVKLLEQNAQKNKNTWIVEPTKINLEQTYAFLYKLFPDRIVSLSSNKDEIEEVFQKKHTNSIFISTPQNISVLTNLSIYTIWINNEGHGAYRIGKLPSIDSKDMLLEIFSGKVARIIFSDICLSLKTHIQKYKKLNYKELPLLEFKIVAKQKTEKNLKSLSPSIFINSQIETIFKKSLLEKKKILLVTQKTGLASKILCNDCKKQVVCTICKKPVSLITKKGEIFFECANKKHLENPLKKCIHCQSWNLISLGIGTDTIKKYIEDVYSINAKQIDNRATTTALKIKKVLSEKESQVYITTELGLPYLKEVQFDEIIVVTFDSLLYSGNYTVEEKIVRLLHLLSTISKNIYFQTRLNDYTFLEEIRKNQKSWIDQEIVMRKKIQAPPYGKEYTIRKIDRNYQESIIYIEEILLSEKISYKKRLDTLNFKTTKKISEKLHLALKMISDKDATIEIH